MLTKDILFGRNPKSYKIIAQLLLFRISHEPERHSAFGMTPSASVLFSPRSRVYYVFPDSEIFNGLKCLVPVPLWLVRQVLSDKKSSCFFKESLQALHIVDVICCWHPGLPRRDTFKKVNVFRVGSSIPEIFRSHLVSSKRQLPNRFSLTSRRSDKIRNDGLVRMSISLIKHLHEFTWKKIYWPDYACLWYFAGKKVTKKLLRQKNYDAVISVSLPFTSHLVGLWIKKHHPKIKCRCWLRGSIPIVGWRRR